jgi:hypothetical protein
MGRHDGHQEEWELQDVHPAESRNFGRSHQITLANGVVCSRNISNVVHT